MQVLSGRFWVGLVVGFIISFSIGSCIRVAMAQHRPAPTEGRLRPTDAERERNKQLRRIADALEKIEKGQR